MRRQLTKKETKKFNVARTFTDIWCELWEIYNNPNVKLADITKTPKDCKKLKAYIQKAANSLWDARHLIDEGFPK